MAAGSVSKMLLPEAFTGSNDFESYLTHFELLAELQIWKRTEPASSSGAAREIDERPHYFALRLQKSAIEFHRTLPQNVRGSYDETVKAFRNHYSEKPIVFRGRLARRVQHPGEKLTDFLGDLKHVAHKAYPEESQDIRDHSVLRDFLEGIHHSQVRLDLRKTLEDKYMTVDKALERALHLEAVTRVEEEEQVPQIAAIRQDDSNKSLIEAVNGLVQKLSGTADGNSRESGGNSQGWVNTRREYQGQNNFNQNQGRSNLLDNEKSGFPNNDKNFNRNFKDSCTGGGQKGHKIKQCRNCFHCGCSQHIKRYCPNRKPKQTTESANVIKVCSTSTTKCFTIQILIQGQMKVGLVDSGSSVSLISVELLKAIVDTKRIDAYNNRVLAANNTSVKILGKVELLVQMKPKQPEFLHEFFVTQENHIPLLLGLDILTDQKCILDLNEKILLCGRDKFSIPLNTQNVNNVNSFTLLLELLIIPARHEAWIDVIVKNENAEVTKKSQGLVEGLKDFENRAGVLVADCLISVNDTKRQLWVVNLSDNDIKLFQNTKIGEFFSNDDSIQVNGLFTRSFPDGVSCNIRGDSFE